MLQPLLVVNVDFISPENYIVIRCLNVLYYSMPTEAVEKPVEETKPEESASSDSDDDDSLPELEEQDAAALQQQSQV